MIYQTNGSVTTNPSALMQPTLATNDNAMASGFNFNANNNLQQTLGLLTMILQLLQQIGQQPAANSNGSPGTGGNSGTNGTPGNDATTGTNNDTDISPATCDHTGSCNCHTTTPAPADNIPGIFSSIAGGDNLIQSGESDAMLSRFTGDDGLVSIDEFSAYSSAVGTADETGPALFRALAGEEGMLPEETVRALVETIYDLGSNNAERFDDMTLENHQNFVDTLNQLATPLPQDRPVPPEVEDAFTRIAGVDNALLPGELDGVINTHAGDDGLFTADEFAVFSKAIALPAAPAADLFKSLASPEGMVPAQLIMTLGHGAVSLANGIAPTDPMNLSQYNNFISGLTEMSTANNA